MRQRPGIVLLFEPFWLATDASARSAPALVRALLAQGGWPALRESVRSQAETPAAKIPIRPDWEALVHGCGLVVFDQASKDQAIAAFGASFASRVEVVPTPMPLRPGSRSHSRQLLALREHEVLVCVPAPLGTAPALTTLVRAWKRLQAPPQGDARLVLLGSVGGADAAELQAELSGSGVIVAGSLSDTAAAIWLDAADLCVVLSPPEMPVFEQQHRLLGHMARALAVATDFPAAALPESTAARFDPTSESDLVRVLGPLCASAQSRRVRMEATHQQLRSHHSRRGSADCLAASVLRLHAARGIDALRVAGEIAKSCPDLGSEQRAGIAAALVRNFPPPARRRQLLIDISELVQHDARSGIQRVVRAVLMELVSINPQDFDLQPVCATDGAQGYRYARSFMCGFVGVKSDWTLDDAVEAWPGDVFFGLDFQPNIGYVQREVLRRWQRRGVRLQFLVYDLLPLLRPDCFPEGARATHHRWLSLLSEFDGAICISRAVADEYLAWLDAFGSRRGRPLAVNWAHLGADLAGSVPTTGVPPESAAVLEALRGRPSWLLVGTIEPRKGYRQVIDAFEALWRSGFDVNLVIVGKLGWHMDDLAQRLRQHDELGHRFFWLEAISDEYLDLIYAHCSCLICASEGEGFGLPIIEAAKHGMPLICRDIEVFREVAGSHATYFADTPQPAALVEVIRHWLVANRAGTHPGSLGIRWLSWKDCASRLLEILRGDDAYRHWRPPAAQARWGNDPDASSEVGRPIKDAVSTTGRAGLLYAGAQLELAAGEYDLCMELAGAELTGDEWVEVVSLRGEERLLLLQLGAAGSSPGSFRARLRLESKVPDLQVRLRVAEASKLSLSRVALVPA